MRREPFTGFSPLFFSQIFSREHARIGGMTDKMEPQQAEAELKGILNSETLTYQGVPSVAGPPRESERLDSLLLRDEERSRMPLTKEKYTIRENPNLVQWERETRKFLRRLSPRHGHRVASVMVFEWATGIPISEYIEKVGKPPLAHMRHINTVLRHYFGKGYATYIAGRKVLNCYRVPPGWYVRQHRPLTMELHLEYMAKTLNP